MTVKKRLILASWAALTGLVVMLAGCFENVPEGGLVPSTVDRAEPAIGIESAKAFFAPEGGEIRLRLHVLGQTGAPIDGLGLDNFAIQPFYGESSGRWYQFNTVKAATPTPRFGGEALSVAIVLDQSDNIINEDPNDLRIEAAKRLLSHLSGRDEAVVFAYASGGSLAFPVTYWEGFTGDVGVFDDTLDALVDLEGGQAPLYDAIAAALQLSDAEASNPDRVVVALTAGLDSASTSFRSADLLIEYAKELGIPVVTVGLGTGIDRNALSRIALSLDGLFFPLAEGGELLSSFEAVPSIFKGEQRPYAVWLTMTVDPPTLPFSGTLTPVMEIMLPEGDVLNLPLSLTW